MTKYRIRAEAVSRFSMIVEAKNPAEARKIAESTEIESPRWDLVDSHDYPVVMAVHAVVQEK